MDTLERRPHKKSSYVLLRSEQVGSYLKLCTATIDCVKS